MKQILRAAICIIIGILIGFATHDILRWIYSTKHTESIAGERFGIILEDESIPLSQADADAIISICKSYENNTQPFTGIKMRQVVDRHVFVVHAWRFDAYGYDIVLERENNKWAVLKVVTYIY